MLHQAIRNSLETKIISRGTEVVEKTNGNYRTEKDNNQNKNLNAWA